MLHKSKRTWIVVADGARARFFAVTGDMPELVPALPVDAVAAEAHGHSRDLKSDRPGRSFSTAGGGARHAVEPRHDFHKFEKHKFAAEVVKLLEAANQRQQFDRFALVAPSRSLGEFRTLLPPDLRGKLCLEVAKDLTKHPAHELWEHMAPLLTAAPR